MFYDFFLVIHVCSNNSCYVYADVGPERPAGMSPIVRRTHANHDPRAEGGKGGELIQNLEGITQGIPDYARLADVPLAYQ